MRGILANIKATPRMSDAEVRHDLRRVRRKRPDWIVWNELGKHRSYRRILRELFPPDEWKHVRVGGRNMVTLNRDTLAYEGKAVRRLHWGLVGVNPSRFDGFVHVRELANGLRYDVEGTHWVNGAWNRKRKRKKAWRKRMWRRGRRVVATRHDVAHQLGRSAIGGGDLNRARVRELHPAWEWLHNGRRIVKTWKREGSGPHAVRFMVDKLSTIPRRRLNTDKPALVIDYRTVR